MHIAAETVIPQCGCSKNAALSRWAAVWEAVLSRQSSDSIIVVKQLII
jgi:hypothetical protein